MREQCLKAEKVVVISGHSHCLEEAKPRSFSGVTMEKTKQQMCCSKEIRVGEILKVLISIWYRTQRGCAVVILEYSVLSCITPLPT